MEIVKFKFINKEYSQLDFSYNERIIGIIKKIGGSFWSQEASSWYANNKKVKFLIKEFKENDIAIRVDGVIQKYLKLHSNGKTDEEINVFKLMKQTHPSYLTHSKFDQSILPIKKGMELYPYQKAGVEYGINKNGRVLIGDDMGLGKTAQAITLASYYKQDWPLIVVAPASLLFNWRKELLMWLEFLNEDDIKVIKKGSERPSGVVTICSYNYASQRQEWLSQYMGARGTLIVDEAHAMKNNLAKRTISLVALSHFAKRCILISGTPFLNKPIEIWPLLYAINPLHTEWKDYNSFAEKFCEGKLIKINNRSIFYVNGASRMNEFHNLVRDEAMVRRLNTDDGVLEQLPEKIRVTQYFESDKKSQEKQSEELLSNLVAQVNEYYDKKKNNLRELKKAILSDNSEIEGDIFRAYKIAGESKIKSICEWVETKLDEGLKKIIIFGHHNDFLNNIQEILEKKKVGFMRIDGSTPKNKRFDNTESFQNDEDCQVALLSIGAGSVGLTLTSGYTVLMGEIPWTPAIARQAEARAHRNGQKQVVVCYYALANNTLDGYLWNMLSRKSTTSSVMLDGGGGDEMEENMDVNSGDILDAIILGVADSRIKELEDSK